MLYTHHVSNHVASLQPELISDDRDLEFAEVGLRASTRGDEVSNAAHRRERRVASEKATG